MIEALIKKGAPEEDFEDGLYEYMDTWSYNRKKERDELTEEDIAKYENRFFKPEEGFEYENIDGEAHFIGIPWRNIKDDETGAEFKARIEAKMKELFGDDVKCGTHEEAWYPC
jgi:hypothetical protein